MAVDLRNDSLQGAMAQIVRDDPRLHLMCPAGIGDLAWIVCKMGPLARKRRIKFWIPGSEQKRCGEYLGLLGLDYGYIDRPDFKTVWVWSRPAAPHLPSGNGWVSLHANSFVNDGERIEKWYPALPCAWPDTKAKGVKLKDDFVLMFACTRWYMGGQRPPKEWAAIAKHIAETVAPVKFFGAHNDVDFAKEIQQDCNAEGIFDRPFKEVLQLMKSPQCKAVVGVASGPLIVNVYEGHAPTLLAYPDHLAKMPGSWEPPDAKWHSCKLGEIWPWIRNGGVGRMIR